MIRKKILYVSVFLLFFCVAFISSMSFSKDSNTNYILRYCKKILSEEGSLTVQDVISKSFAKNIPHYTIYYTRGTNRLHKLDYVKDNDIQYSFLFKYEGRKLSNWKVVNDDGQTLFTWKYTYDRSGNLMKLEKILSSGDEGEGEWEDDDDEGEWDDDDEGEWEDDDDDYGEGEADGYVEYYYTYDYDANGDLERKNFFEGEELKYYDLYFYDENGNLSDINRIYPDKVTKIKVTKERKEQAVKKTTKSSRKSKYDIKYYKAFKMIEGQKVKFTDAVSRSKAKTTDYYFKVFYNRRNALIRSIERKNQRDTAIDYYDDNSRIIKKEIFNPATGKLKQRLIYRRDENGNLLGQEMYDSEGNLME